MDEDDEEDEADDEDEEDETDEDHNYTATTFLGAHCEFHGL